MQVLLSYLFLFGAVLCHDVRRGDRRLRSLELFDLVRGRRKNQAWKVWLTKVWSSFSWRGLGTIEAGRTDKRERGSLEADRARRRAFLHFQTGEGKFERPKKCLFFSIH